MVLCGTISYADDDEICVFNYVGPSCDVGHGAVGRSCKFPVSFSFRFFFFLSFLSLVSALGHPFLTHMLLWQTVLGCHGAKLYVFKKSPTTGIMLL